MEKLTPFTIPTDNLVICLIAVALLGKHKYYQEIKPYVFLKKSFRASFLGQLSNAG